MIEPNDGFGALLALLSIGFPRTPSMSRPLPLSVSAGGEAS